MYKYVCVYMHIYVSVYMCKHVYVYVYRDVYIFICIYACINMCICVCISIYLYVYLYLSIYLSIYICNPRPRPQWPTSSHQSSPPGITSRYETHQWNNIVTPTCDVVSHTHHPVTSQKRHLGAMSVEGFEVTPRFKS